jgi:hypothetical protein
MNWVDMVQDMNQWRDPVNTLMKLRVGKKFSEILERLHNWRCLKYG